MLNCTSANITNVGISDDFIPDVACTGLGFSKVRGSSALHQLLHSKTRTGECLFCVQEVCLKAVVIFLILLLQETAQLILISVPGKTLLELGLDSFVLCS